MIEERVILRRFVANPQQKYERDFFFNAALYGDLHSVSWTCRNISLFEIVGYEVIEIFKILIS